jgi:hypothetical protein
MHVLVDSVPLVLLTLILSVPLGRTALLTWVSRSRCRFVHTRVVSPCRRQRVDVRTRAPTLFVTFSKATLAVDKFLISPEIIFRKDDLTAFPWILVCTMVPRCVQPFSGMTQVVAA